MAGGAGVTVGPGTDRYAEAFNRAGFSVLAFDYRHLGASDGEPRQLVRVRRQLEDWDEALELAAGLDGVDPARRAVWGFSLSGGHVLKVAARHPELAAVIAQSPNADGRASSRNAMRHQSSWMLLRLLGRGVLDALGGTVGRPPRLVPLAGKPGTLAMLSTPDAIDGDRALNGADYPEWHQEIAARSALRLSFYRPGRAASRIRCPLMVVVAEDDSSALGGPAERVARRVPDCEILRIQGGHYASYLVGFGQTSKAECGFLGRHLQPTPSSGGDQS